mgnify:CR=1 FL=1
MNRSPQMQEFVNDMSEKLFGRKPSNNQCVSCGSEKVKQKDFRDDLSYKEFTMSHMYQECQDSVFGR